ncbi:MAG: twin-arginine translocase subunit TatB [Sphingobium sp.]|nr:twin-arginine translocase subunit TatB [Sphingobium sp.]
MFGIDSTELLLIVIVAVVVIGPKDLPRALYKIGQVIGKARAMSRHFRSGLDAMIREAELEELQKQWDKENARIMAEHPMEPVTPEKALVDGTAEAAAESETEQPTPDAAVDTSLVEAVKQSQTPPVEEAPPAEPEVPKDAAAS